MNERMGPLYGPDLEKQAERRRQLRKQAPRLLREAQTGRTALTEVLKEMEKIDPFITETQSAQLLAESSDPQNPLLGVVLEKHRGIPVGITAYHVHENGAGLEVDEAPVTVIDQHPDKVEGDLLIESNIRFTGYRKEEESTGADELNERLRLQEERIIKNLAAGNGKV